MVWIAREHPVNEPFERRKTRIAIPVWKWRHVRPQDRLQDLRSVVAGERRFSTRDLVDHGAEREHVRASIHLAAGGLFRGDVRERADEAGVSIERLDRARHVVGARRTGGPALRDAEIQHLHASRRRHHQV